MAQTKNNAKLFDLSTLIAAGFDPKTGLPLRYDDGDGTNLKQNTFATLSVIDRQDAINKYTWYNLPPGITQELLETILYYKGQGMFFYEPALEKFFFLPFALQADEGTGIDCYGRFTGVTPIQLGSTTNEDNKVYKFNGLTYKPQYEPLLETPTLEEFDRSCVLLRDYTHGISQTVVPRATLQAPILDVMSNCIPYLNTCLMSATGVAGMKVNSEKESEDVAAASQGVQKAALTGKKWIPIVGSVDFQDLSTNTAGRADEFLMSLQALDNFRLSLHGLDNGGVFQKKTYQTNSQTELNMGASISLVLQDGLTRRQEFCNIVNSIWPLGIWCDISEQAAGGDMNMDGVVGDEKPVNEQEQGGQEDGNSND